MSVRRLKNDAIDAAQKHKARYKQTLDPNDLDLFKRLMDVYNHLDGVGGGVGLFSQIEDGPSIFYTDGDVPIAGAGVGSLSVPANYFSVGDTFSLHVHGDMTSANNAQIAIRLKESSIVISEVTVTTVATVGEHFDLKANFIVRAIGGPGVAKLFTVGVFSYSKSSNNTPEVINFDFLEQTNFDTTIATTLSVNAEWLTSESVNEIFTQSLNLYKIF